MDPHRKGPRPGKGSNMIPQIERNRTRQRIHLRIRRKVQGTAERPRLNVYRSLNNIYVQLVDDLNGVTIASANTVEKKDGKKGSKVVGGNLASAKAIGKLIADRGKEKGIKKVVF